MQRSKEEEVVGNVALGEGTPSSSHSWMHGDEATPESPHRLFEEDAAPKFGRDIQRMHIERALLSLDAKISEEAYFRTFSEEPIASEGTPESLHSWMHEPTSV